MYIYAKVLAKAFAKVFASVLAKVFAEFVVDVSANVFATAAREPSADRRVWRSALGSPMLRQVPLKGLRKDIAVTIAVKNVVMKTSR